MAAEETPDHLEDSHGTIVRETSSWKRLRLFMKDFRVRALLTLALLVIIAFAARGHYHFFYDGWAEQTAKLVHISCLQLARTMVPGLNLQMLVKIAEWTQPIVSWKHMLAYSAPRSTPSHLAIFRSCSLSSSERAFVLRTDLWYCFMLFLA